MNIANKLTVARVFLIPVFLIFLLVPFEFGTLDLVGSTVGVSQFIATVIFIVASLTDWLDGYYARKFDLVTNFGKFFDPLADKLLVMSAFVSLIALDIVPAWMVIIILSREMAVTGLRVIAAGEGTVLAASGMGKWKTAFQMSAIILLLLNNFPIGDNGFPLANIVLWLAVVMTALSGADYFVKNREVYLKSM